MRTLTIPIHREQFLINRDVIDNKDTDSPPLKDCSPLLQMPTVQRPSAAGIVDASSLNREEARRKTFNASWPHGHLDTNLLAQTGFYFVGPSDNVKCFFCKVEIGRWEPNDHEVTEHQRWSMNCPLLRRRSTNNVPIDAVALDRVLPPVTIDVCGPGINVRHNTVSEGSFDVFPGASEFQSHGQSMPVDVPPFASAYQSPLSVPAAANTSSIRCPEHPEYAIESARLRSFEDWPKTMKQKPQELSDAGFFYTMKGDRVKCFSCGGGLRDWDEMDVPWEQHAQWFGHCEYLQLIKGQEYIDQVKAANSTTEEGEQMVVNQAKTAKNINFDVESSIASALQLPVDDDAGSGAGNASCGSKLCKICYSCEYNTAFLPCGHVVACAKCASSVSKCPVCRKPFERVMRVYFS